MWDAALGVRWPHIGPAVTFCTLADVTVHTGSSGLAAGIGGIQAGRYTGARNQEDGVLGISDAEQQPVCGGIGFDETAGILGHLGVKDALGWAVEG